MARPTTTVDRPAEDVNGRSDEPPVRDSEATERAIPIRPSDLNRLLLADPGLAPADRHLLGQFIKLLNAVFHHEYRSWLNELKDRYAPLDPDADCANLPGLTTGATEDADEAFLKPFEAALIRANYRPLKLEVIEQAIAAPNEKGLTYVPDFSLFEHLKVYVRGTTKVCRIRRSLQTKFRKQEIKYDGYQRFVVALKFKPGVDLDSYVRSDVLYLRLFKDVPHVDMEMHLPEQGTKVKMRLIDKAQIASPLVAFPATVAFKFIGFTLRVMASDPWQMLTPAALMLAPITAGINSFFGFQRAKQRHFHGMIRHLYYLTLAHNGSVITQMVDSAEEEDYKEALLAYYCLWRHREDEEPWSSARVDACIETLIKQHTGREVNFEVGDALSKLFRLGLAQPEPRGGLRAVPIERALEILDGQWDDYFRFATHDRPAATGEE